MAFTFGVSWAALSDVIPNIKKNTIIYSIAVGAVANVFTALILGNVGTLLPSPWILYLVGVGIILLIFGYQKYRERGLLYKFSQSQQTR
ncbi:MAG: hypothetical protein ACUVQM_00930 [Candidatus Hadarchaeaceae archaeon]